MARRRLAATMSAARVPVGLPADSKRSTGARIEGQLKSVDNVHNGAERPGESNSADKRE